MKTKVYGKIIAEDKNVKLYQADIKPKKIGLGIPLSWPFCHSDFFDSFMMLFHRCLAGKEIDHIEVIRASSGPIHEMRNTITKRAMEIECSHLMFIDADMVYPDDAIIRLVQHNLPICGALTFKRWPPFSPVMFRGKPGDLELFDYTEHEDGLTEVTATGTGCLLINMSVFDEIPYPWFDFGQTEDGRPIGEDVNFCYKAAELGYKIYVDTTIRTEHLCQVRVNDNMWKMNKALIESGQGQFYF
jgi:hypothetical protein